MKSDGKVDFFRDGATLWKEREVGFKIGNLLEQGWGWRDITSQVVLRGTGSNDPTWAQIGSGPFYGYRFDVGASVGDECWMSFHIPHDIVPDSDIHFHTHWIPDGTDTAPVKWQYTYTYARGFDQDAFSSTGTTVSAQSDGPGVAYQHMVTETAAVTIPNLDEPDGMLYVHIRRMPNGATDNANGIFMLTSDVHYQSTNMATKGKAPDFYT